MIGNPMLVMQQAGGNSVKMATGTVLKTSGDVNINVGFKPSFVIFSALYCDSGGALAVKTFAILEPENDDTVVISWSTTINIGMVPTAVTFTYTVQFTQDGITITQTSSNSQAPATLPFASNDYQWVAIGK